MKVIAIVALCIVAALAAPQHPDKDAHVVRSDLDNIGVDGYNFAYETSNGISASEEGHVVNPGSEAEAIQVRGHYSYAGPDKVTYEVEYVADENGFQPQGAHLPHA